MFAKEAGMAPDKGYIGLGMEGPIATWYAKNTLQLGQDHAEALRAVRAHTPGGGTILEVAPGPGYLAIDLARAGQYRVTGLDISRTFVEIAQANARAAAVTVDFRLGNAAEMPFDENAFDCLVCKAAFKNFSEPVRALNEMHRVLKPGGTAMIFDLRGDASPAEINRHVDQMGMSWLNARFTRLAFKHMLLKRAYTAGEFQKLAAQSAFGRAEITRQLIGLEARLVK